MSGGLNTLGLEKVFDDILVESRIVINEELLAIESGDLVEVFEKYKDQGFHRIIIEYRDDRGNTVFKIYRYRDLILALISETPEGKKLGIEASGVLQRFITKKANPYSIRVFKVKDEVLKDIIGDEKYGEILSLTEKESEEAEASISVEASGEKTVGSIVYGERRAETPVEVSAGENIEEAVVAGKIGEVNYREEIKKIIEELGLEEIFIDVVEEPESTKITVELNPIPTWISLRSILYAVVSAYLKHKDPGSYPPVKAVVKMGDLSESMLLIDRRELLVARITGEILYELSRNGIPVLDSDYRIEKGGELVLLYKVKKPVYPGVSIEEVLKKVYEEVKNLWDGKLIIRVKKGRFSTIQIP